MRVFVAAPERGVPAPDGSVVAILAAAREAGHEVVHEPGGASPSVVPQADRASFLLAHDRMLEAEAVLAEVSTPSHGVGWAVAWFLARGRLAVLCCARDRRDRLSALLAGNPSPWQRLVVYDSPDDLRPKLLAILRR